MKTLPLKKLTLLLAALLVVLTSVRCGRGGFMLAQAAITMAAVATVIAVHDAHYHDYYCGHRYVVVEDRPVYYYQDRWEYYDAPSGRWYMYEELPR